MAHMNSGKQIAVDTARHLERLVARIAELERRVSALEKATPPHMRTVEARGTSFKLGETARWTPAETFKSRET